MNITIIIDNPKKKTWEDKLQEMEDKKIREEEMERKRASSASKNSGIIQSLRNLWPDK